jgi:Na+/melibiose symporter-like transporter
MFQSETRVLVILPRDLVDRARVLAGRATTSMRLSVSVQIVLRALIEEGLKRPSDPALLANAGTFLVVASVLPLLSARRRPEPGPEGATHLQEARQGFAFIHADRLLLLVVLTTAVMVVFGAIDNVAEVFFAKDVLGAGDTGYGLLITTWTIGMVAGSTASIGRGGTWCGGNREAHRGRAAARRHASGRTVPHLLRHAERT